MIKKVALAILAAALVLAGCAKPATKAPDGGQLPPAPTPQVLFHKDQLAQITGVRIHGNIGEGSKTTTDAKLTAPVLDALKQATPAPKPAQDYAGTGNMVDLLLPGQAEPIFLQYWTGVQPGLFDIQAQQFWQVPGLDEALKPLLPPKFLTLDDMLARGKAIDPDAEWWPRFTDRNRWQVDADQVWLLVALTKDGRRLGYYFDPVTGGELGQDVPWTTDAAVGVVRQYFGLTAKGDYNGAWELINSIARQPMPNAKPDEIKQMFLTTPETALVKITGSAWHRDYWKFYGCQCMQKDVVDVNIETTGGAQKTVHVAQDNQDGAWRLFWMKQNGLE